MVLADNSSIIGFIISFPYFLDIIIILFLFVGASIGYARGFWRGTFNLIISVILLLVSWFVLLDALAIFVNTRLFSLLGVTFKVGNLEATSMEEFVKCLVEMGKNDLPEKYLNPDYISALSLSISKSIAWLIVVISINLLSWILSGILYFLIMRLIIPERLRKIKLRLVGALMGLIQTMVIVFSYMISFSNISPAMESIRKYDEDVGWFNPNIQMVLEAFNPYNSMLAPYVEGLNKVVEGKFAFVIDDIEYKLDNELKEFLDLLSDISKKLQNQDDSDDTENEENIEFVVSNYVTLS
ncbi:MAG: hypothetical protein J1F32_06560 [Erysipelotrichales bacterium]|nr:hypothetical protein [Erysipelotrichales bacterium]